MYHFIDMYVCVCLLHACTGIRVCVRLSVYPGRSKIHLSLMAKMSEKKVGEILLWEAGERKESQTEVIVTLNLPSLLPSCLQMSKLSSTILMSNAGLHKCMHHANVVFQLWRGRENQIHNSCGFILAKLCNYHKSLIVLISTVILADDYAYFGDRLCFAHYHRFFSDSLWIVLQGLLLLKFSWWQLDNL